MKTDPSRPLLRRPVQALRRRVVELYRPIDFGARSDLDSPVTATDLREVLGWDRLLEQGAVTGVDDPLSVGELRPSLLFPQKFLHRRGDGRSVLVSLQEAAGLVTERLHTRVATDPR